MPQIPEDHTQKTTDELVEAMEDQLYDLIGTHKDRPEAQFSYPQFGAMYSNMKIKAESAKNDLRRLAESIERDMQVLQQRLDEHGLDASVNTLGELQSRGTDLDRRCAEFGAVVDTLRTFHQNFANDILDAQAK